MIEEIREILRRYDQALITEDEAKVKIGMVIINYGDELSEIVQKQREEIKNGEG
jgi:hypothetical protein